MKKEQVIKIEKSIEIPNMFLWDIEVNGLKYDFDVYYEWDKKYNEPDVEVCSIYSHKFKRDLINPEVFFNRAGVMPSDLVSWVESELESNEIESQL